MADRALGDQEIQDRFAIADLYDRQLAAAESWDLDAYDTTFVPDAEIDLRDFGQPVRCYRDYREWLASLRPVMPRAQRITGGLRLRLDGDRATTRVPVACFVHFDTGDGPRLTYTGLFYNDTLRRTADGWRITTRYEELAWQGGPEE
jgi:SnoaL-like protein